MVATLAMARLLALTHMLDRRLLAAMEAATEALLPAAAVAEQASGR